MSSAVLIFAATLAVFSRDEHSGDMSSHLPHVPGFSEAACQH